MITQIQKINDIFVKREDLYEVNGVNGGKVRTIRNLLKKSGGRGIITAGPRASSQAYMAARFAHHNKIPCRIHMPLGSMTKEMEDAYAHHAEIIQHKAGYNNVLHARAMEDHKNNPEWCHVPLWLRCREMVTSTMNQVVHIPHSVERIVVCVGSGMSAAGILHGLKKSHLGIPVLGVQVGADPIKTLNSFAGFGWHHRMELVDVSKKYKYTDKVKASLGPISLDPGYEAKCFELLKPNDLLWIVGYRNFV